MGTPGYFAFRYKRQYYRRYLCCSAYPSFYGQQFANSIPRDPSTFKEWVSNRIDMLENAKLSNEEVTHEHPPADSPKIIFNEALVYERRDDLDWTFPDGYTSYTYVIDLDNLVFTVNGATHLKLDNMPPGEPGLKVYFDDDDGERIEVPSQYLSTTVDLWPAPGFDIEERRKKYEELNPIVTPAVEWGALTWDRLSIAQRLSIDLVHHLISNMSSVMDSAYVSHIRKTVGQFCWNVLCAATSSVPFFDDDVWLQLYPEEYRTLSSGHNRSLPPRMCDETGAEPFKKLKSRSWYGGDYCWVRGCLVTFCVRLGEQAYVVHEVEQMVQKMRLDGHAECIGIILSSQQEMVAVAVDDGLESTRQVRHTPVLDIRPTPDKPGHASHGLLLLIHLLSPPLMVPPPPWRTPPPRQPSPVQSWLGLPPEVLQYIIRYSDADEYLSLCRVSKSIRSVCLAHPRFGDYTILYRLPEHRLTYAARSIDDDATVLLCLYLEYFSYRSPVWKGQVRPWEDLQSLVSDLDVDAGKECNND